VHAITLAKEYSALGFGIIATTGTAKAINEAGIECESVLKISEGRPNIEDHLKNGEISMVINTSDNRSVKDDTTKIRQSAVRFNVPYITTVAAANAAIEAAKGLQKGELDVKAIQDYLG
jgi:carbamoyl-phosphate synthase large subunit